MTKEMTAPWRPFEDAPSPGAPWQDATGTWHVTRWADVTQILPHDQVLVDHTVRHKLERITHAFPHKYGAWRVLYHMASLANGDEHLQLRKLAAMLSGDLHQQMPGDLVQRYVNRAIQQREIEVLSGFASPAMDEWCAALFDTSVEDMHALRRAGFNLIFYVDRFLQKRDVNAMERQAELALAAYAKAMNRPNNQMEPHDYAVFHLVVFGFSVLAAFCSNTLAYLADHPKLQNQLRDNADLRPGFLREAERLLSPTRYLHRVTGADPIALQGVTLPPHSLATVDLFSANRDPALCDEPLMLDPSRPKCAHVSFAVGPHRCLGIQASRRFMAALLDALLPVACVSPGTGQRLYENNVMLETPQRLPLRFDPLPAAN